MDVVEIRKQFPITNRYVFMNHAGVAPIPNCTRDAITQTLREINESASEESAEWDRKIRRAREAAADLIGAASEEIAFTKNTTEGILFVANGIDWSEGDNVVVPDQEFPANVYPWWNLKRLGVETRTVPVVDGRVPFKEIEARVDERTRCVAISFVQFASGFRADLKHIGEMCEERGIFLCVDAIQGLGALRLDVKECKIHFLSADGHKWLLGPEGAGIFYCDGAMLDRLHVASLGWMGVVNPSDYLAYDMTPRPDARRFECGSYNTVGIIGLGASLEFLLGVGIESIERRVLAITDLLCDGLVAKGYDVYSPRGEGEKSGIVCFSHADHRSEDLVRMLEGNGVVARVRSGRVRLSPHFYNTEEEMERVLALLP
ncbi:MAG: aminotransferase class V-fold PLP-dependent enzyme [Planctomycetes bacterium]|nr:aminotransferase class V-fold PLP-dependent enzyme [Planctomycetota bacterium]